MGVRVRDHLNPKDWGCRSGEWQAMAGKIVLCATVLLKPMMGKAIFPDHSTFFRKKVEFRKLDVVLTLTVRVRKSFWSAAGCEEKEPLAMGYFSRTHYGLFPSGLQHFFQTIRY